MKILLISFVSIFLSFNLSADECVYSKWGVNDQKGSANLISKESILDASALIKKGKVYSLGITIDSNTPSYPPRSITLQVVQPSQQFGAKSAPNSTYNDDLIQGWLGIGSQLDGLGHMGDANGVFYNCNDGKDISDISGLKRLGIENVPPLVARGIVLDMASYFKVDYLEGGQSFTVEDVKAVEKNQGTYIKEGDVVLFHTGWTDAKLNSEPELWGSVEPGQGPEVAEYLASKRVLAVGADTWGLDVVPSKDPNLLFQGHVILLKENGIYILETMNTGPLIDDNVHEFMFVLGHAKVKGAVQMYINPIAIN